MRVQNCYQSGIISGIGLKLVGDCDVGCAILIEIAKDWGDVINVQSQPIAAGKQPRFF